MGTARALRALDPLKEFSKILQGIDKAIQVGKVTNFLSAFGETSSLKAATKVLSEYGMTGKRSLEDMGEAYQIGTNALGILLRKESLLVKMNKALIGTEKGIIGLETQKGLTLLYSTRELLKQGKVLVKYNKLSKKFQMRSLRMLGAMFGLMSVSKLYQKTLGLLVSSTQMWSWYMEDVAYDLEDISDLLMEPLEDVFFEPMIGVLETVLGWLEKIDPRLRGVAGGILLVGGAGLEAASWLGQMGVALWGMKAGLYMLLETFPRLIPYWEKFQDILSALVHPISTIKTGIAKLTGVLIAHGISWKMVAVSAGLAIASFMAAYMIGSMLRKSLGPVKTALLAIIPGLMAVATAAAIMHGTLTLGTALPILAATIAASAGLIAAAFAPLSFEGLRGGIEFTEPSTIRVHEGERLYGKGGRAKYQPKPVPLVIDVNISGISSLEEAMKKVSKDTAEQVADHFDRKYRRQEY